MSHCGSREEGPTPQGVQIADLAAGSLSAVIGILAAVVHRGATGEGQIVDVSMFDGSVALNAFAAAQWLGGGELPQRESMGLNGGSQYGYYRTKDGGYLSVGSLEAKFWIGFCQAIERPDLIDRLTMPGEAMRPVIEEIRQVIASKTLAEWTAIFADHDVCVEPVLTLEETFQHPHTLARGMRVEVPKPDGSTQRQAGSPIKFSRAEPVYRHIGADLGAHTDLALSEAGYEAGEIADLRKRGVVA
jgi:alpha-methylacyl-CoA racemase